MGLSTVRITPSPASQTESSASGAKGYRRESLESTEFASAHFSRHAGRGKDRLVSQREPEGGIVLLEDLDETALPLRMGWWDFCQIDPHFREVPVEYRVVEDSDENGHAGR